MGTILTPDELRDLTRRDRSDAQRRELDHIGVPYRVRRDHRLAVLWAHVEAVPGATIPAPQEPELTPP
jgi:hypothetical protein